MKALYNVKLNVNISDIIAYEEYCNWINNEYTVKVNRRFYSLGMFVLELTEEEANQLSLEYRIEYVLPQISIDKAFTQDIADWGLEIACGNAVGDGYKYKYLGTGVKIFVIDSGIELTHQEFNGRAVHGYDAISTGNPTAAADRTPIVSQHGTVVASAAAGLTTGIAKGATVIDCKAGDADPTATPPSSFNNTDIIECINWILSSARTVPSVVNCSWGTTVSDGALNSAIASLIAAGYIVIAAAGNNANATAFYPAALTDVIAVGAIQEDLNIAPFSNYGSWVDIFAPGRFLMLANLNSKLLEVSGTSVAAPIVAGAAACVIEGLSGVNQAMFRKIMIKNRQKNKSIHVKTSTTKDVINSFMTKTWYGDSGTIPGFYANKNIKLKAFKQLIATPDTITYLPGSDRVIIVEQRCPVLQQHGTTVQQQYATELVKIRASLSTDITPE